MAKPPTKLPDLTGKVVLVTGASSGIGEAAALRLAEAGARVLVHGRSPERTVQVAATVGTEPLVADFARLQEVQDLADQIKRTTDRIDVLMHNAGALVPKRIVTEDGHELTFQGNHLATFLLQWLLHDLVVGTAGSRVIVTSSAANRTGHINIEDLDGDWIPYRPFPAYATSKLENILYVRELSRRLAGTGTVSVAVHPGAVATRWGAGSTIPGALFRMPANRAYLLGPESGAEPLVWLATMPKPEQADGLYYDRFEARGKTAAQADDPVLARELWERSEAMVRAWTE
jgi:NAD(P)-dependent dehydrogenase (short-subunit alcohol dehydrogenase family)